jgi:alkanesulfonate monooxygenase SsuD/methylene tetrahydromethanopterin reductase-like flavin-dependent oxidoreductase (luciferase family)
MAHAYSDDERAIVERLRSKALVGTSEQVATSLTALAQRLELDELVINTWTFDPAARRRSYELLADAFGL